MRNAWLPLMGAIAILLASCVAPALPAAEPATTVERPAESVYIATYETVGPASVTDTVAPPAFAVPAEFALQVESIPRLEPYVGPLDEKDTAGDLPDLIVIPSGLQAEPVLDEYVMGPELVDIVNRHAAEQGIDLDLTPYILDDGSMGLPWGYPCNSTLAILREGPNVDTALDLLGEMAPSVLDQCAIGEWPLLEFQPSGVDLVDVVPMDAVESIFNELVPELEGGIQVDALELDGPILQFEITASFPEEEVIASFEIDITELDPDMTFDLRSPSGDEFARVPVDPVVRTLFDNYPFWPPPRPSASDKLPRELLLPSGLVSPTLKHVDDTLRRSLGACGYDEVGYYSAPEGFAIATRPEQIEDDGTPRSDPYRWSSVPPSVFESTESILELLTAYLKALLTAEENHVRTFVFLVTPVAFPRNHDPLGIVEAYDLVTAGFDRLPANVGEMAYGAEHRTSVLVYEFVLRESDEKAEILIPSPYTGRIHLERAGLLGEEGNHACFHAAE